MVRDRGSKGMDGCPLTATDSLSQQLPALEDLPEDNDFEEWIDDSYGFFMELANW
jgi:hypothetical protein